MLPKQQKLAISDALTYSRSIIYSNYTRINLQIKQIIKKYMREQIKQFTCGISYLLETKLNKGYLSFSGVDWP